MNLQQLETFLTVVELGSFTKTAQRLNSTQSTVSMRIAELERELGVQLPDRSQRHIRPTSKGRGLPQSLGDLRSRAFLSGRQYQWQ